MLARLCFAASFAAAASPSLFQRLLYKPIPLQRPTDHAEFMYSNLPPENLRPPEPDERFDYIVIGGGGAGCPFARTMADAGYKVLLLERGGLRENHPVTWSLKGTGPTLMDNSVSQPVLTTEGYVTHVGSVLGGGTAVNLGFYIEGNDRGFTSQFNDSKKWIEATRWIRRRLANPAKKKDQYYASLSTFAADISRNHSRGTEPEYIFEHDWHGSTIYHPKDDFRYSADTLLGPIAEFPRSLVLSVNSKVRKIEFTRDAHTRKLAAQCVRYSHVQGNGGALLGLRESVVGALQNEGTLRAWFGWYPNIRKYLGDLFISNRDVRQNSRVCLNDSADAEIILSAGAILSPGLLYDSGIGPIKLTSRLGVSNILELANLGRNLADRVFLPLAFYFRNNVTSMHIPAVVQRLALWRPTPKFDQNAKELMLQRSMESEDLMPKKYANRTRMSQLDDLLAFPAVLRPEAEADPIRADDAMTWDDSSQSLCTPGANEEGLVSAASALDISRLHQQTEVLSGFEEISGGLLNTGCGIATRYFLPVASRSSIAVDVALETIYGCAMQQQRSGVLSLCPLVKPILDCLRKSAALVYMMPQPTSLGHLSVGGPDGKTLVVTGGYFRNESDIHTGTVGLADLLQTLNRTSAFDGIFEPVGTSDNVCPSVVRDSLSELFYRVTDMMVPYVSLQEAQDAESALDETLGADIPVYIPELMDAQPEMRGGVVNAQKFASFPAVLPNPRNYAEVSRFLVRHSTSMWHWHGSARIGSVVDDKLRVFGTDRLAIIDASVIGTLPKMNPQVSIMILGRYAALLRVAQRGKAGAHA